MFLVAVGMAGEEFFRSRDPIALAPQKNNCLIQPKTNF
jgi:hypothetical protein